MPFLAAGKSTKVTSLRVFWLDVVRPTGRAQCWAQTCTNSQILGGVDCVDSKIMLHLCLKTHLKTSLPPRCPSTCPGSSPQYCLAHFAGAQEVGEQAASEVTHAGGAEEQTLDGFDSEISGDLTIDVRTRTWPGCLETLTGGFWEPVVTRKHL